MVGSARDSSATPAGRMVAAGLWVAAVLFAPIASPGSEEGTPGSRDATSLRHKVLCGYQGWFRCPGDPAGEGWRHWSRDARRITPGDPDVRDVARHCPSYAADEKYPAPGFTHPDGEPGPPVQLGQPADRRAAFPVDASSTASTACSSSGSWSNLGDPSLDRVLGHVRASAAEDRAGCTPSATT